MRNSYKLIVSGLLIAISIILTRIFSANLLILGVNAARISIGFVPIMLAGILLGPWYGLAVGALADVAGFFIFPLGAYFPPITLTSALAGALPGLLFMLFRRGRLWLQTLLSVAATQIVCSMFLQTLWLSILFHSPYWTLFFPRAGIALATIPVFSVLIYAIAAGLKSAKLAPNLDRRKPGNSVLS